MSNDLPLDLGADLTAPSSYPDVSELSKSCDLVMKGGITSGVVYPLAVCQLATDHKICSVGGTSAGAIAAGAAAAAEVGRSSGGFAKLALLPGWLSTTPPGTSHTNLFHLFQPQPATQRLYRLMSVFIGGGGTARKVTMGLVHGLRLLQPSLAVAILVLGPAILLGLSIWQTTAVGIVAAATLLLLGSALAVLWSVYLSLSNDLGKNLFGICSGLRSAGSDLPGLTEWLVDTIDDAAGRPKGGPPLTFGDLTESGVELAMLSTNISTRSQARLPFTQRLWAFDPVEFRQLFPEQVVDWMENHPPAPTGTKSDQERDAEVFARFREGGLFPLPDEHHLPTIVGVRMSLSFPVLLSAVPLHAIDYTKRDHPIVRHWFSDGGATSNFPLHFFDRAVPGRPTFGINLGSTTSLDLDESNNVYMPGSNLGGILGKPSDIRSFGDFVGALKDTLQNWADNMQTHIPGYRDRIVEVKHTSVEGGLNLDMDPGVVTRLSERGRCAGAVAQQRFDVDNHRWVRYRSFLHVLEEFVRDAAQTYEGSRSWSQRSYEDMIADPPSYKSDWSKAAGADVTEAVLHLANEFDKARMGRTSSRPDGTEVSKTFADGAPNPAPEIQIRPRI